MIVVTGAAGFIGSVLVQRLNKDGFNSIVAVDHEDNFSKYGNLEGKDVALKIHRGVFFDWLSENSSNVEFIFHLGARTDTAEFDSELLTDLNTEYSKKIWKSCIKFQIPLVYASSAATYGNGEFGYDDDHELVNSLKPLNPYGVSKNDFDKWVLTQEETPLFWAGLKFFNVYGPNEYHKQRMASVILHAYNQISKSGEMKLFRSHNPDYSDGGQMRDFVYVKDVVDVCIFLMNHRKDSAIYNLGSGTARTFNDLVSATFDAMSKDKVVEFIDTPIDIRDKYQYFTEANMAKLKSIGYPKEFTSLEDGINDYVVNYLMKQKRY